MARRENPYYVVPLQYENIYDFKEVTKSTLKYSKVDSEGIKVNWMKIKWLRFFKNDAEHVLFKHKFDEDFKKMRVVEVDK
jgi:transcriptional regulator